MSSPTRFFAALFFVFLFSVSVICQDEKPKISEEVTVFAEDATYKDLRNLSTVPTAFGGEYVTVTNLVMVKNEATFTFKSGEIYFLTSAGGKTIGAVFMGSGEFYMTPPTEIEKKNLAIFTDTTEIRETFDALTMFFTDTTASAIKNSRSALIGTNGPQAEKARGIYKEKETRLKTQFRYNIASRMLSDVYAPKRRGFFTAFIDGAKWGKLVYIMDPLCATQQVYPEQVALLSYGESTGGIWTSFHLAGEYKKGTGNSWANRSIYDIKNHNMNVSIDKTRIIAKDEVTLEMREADSRFLPFDLYDSLRVGSVKDETGNSLVFIQEKRGADSDLGVVLPKAVEPGKPFKLTFEYEGGDALLDAGESNFFLGPRSTWYPNNPLSSFGDRASFDITFRYPKKYMMVGVGNRIGTDTTEGDQLISKWSSEGVELAVAGFNYGDFKMKELKDEVTGLNLEVFTNKSVPGDIKNAQSMQDHGETNGTSMNTLGSINTVQGAPMVLAEAQNATRIYEAFFGKMPYKRMAMTQQPAFGFGQAWPTLVFMPWTAFVGESMLNQLGVRDDFWRLVGPHEVAHQWWGHTLGWTSYHDQWMSEGFSEFSASLFIQYVKKNTPEFIDFWENQRKLIVTPSRATNNRKPFTVGPVTQGYRLNSARTGNVARAMIYPKGAFILHMIRMMMFDGRGGTRDARFQKMMKDFVATNYNKDISTNDLKIAVEKHITPEMDIDKNGKMDWFFDEWVYGTEMPSYKFTYSIGVKDGKPTLSGKITQSGVTDKFVMIVPVYIDFGSGPSSIGSVTIVGNSSADLTDIPLPSKPKKVTIAALQDVLAEKIEVSGQ
jgi:Peptidase family M1 domain